MLERPGNVIAGPFFLESASMPADNQSAIPENASPLVRRLGRSVLLTSEEVDYLETMQVNQASIGKGDEFIHDGEPLRVTFLVRRGWVIRYRITPAGRRIIIGSPCPEISSVCMSTSIIPQSSRPRD
jgi:CRP-like cAMP-binding protein